VTPAKPEPKTLDEIAWEIVKRVKDCQNISTDKYDCAYVRAALQQARDRGRAEERKALRAWAHKQHAEIDERRKSAGGRHPGWFFTQLEGEDAAINNLLAALDARESAPAEPSKE